MSDILIFGATSSLGISICRQLAKRGDNLILVGRSKKELENLANDLSIRFDVKIEVILMDLIPDKFSADFLLKKKFDSVFMLVGDMGNGDKNDILNIEDIIKVNFSTPAKILTIIAEIMERRKRGNIVVVSSVAGDRGRQSNYAYGSAKSGIATFTSGLRNRLCKSNVHVLTVKPGFMDTPLTYGLESPLIASRNYVARQIIKALDKKKDAIYVPFLVLHHVGHQVNS